MVAMRVPRKVNQALQCFNAWQHRKVIDDNVKASDIQNAFTTQWKDPNRDFSPHTVTIPSGCYASAAEANERNYGLL